MKKIRNVFKYILDIFGKLIGLPLVIPGVIMLYVGNLILELTRREY